MHLLDSTEGQLDPVRHAKTDLFLLGLGLTIGGLILGGAGFAELYLCQEGSSCYNPPTSNYIGYALAAPGILPLAAGLIILYLFTGGRRGFAEAEEASPRWLLTVAPVGGGGGGVVGATLRF